MATEFETLLFGNLLGIFGGASSIYILAFAFLAIAICFMLVMRLPLPVIGILTIIPLVMLSSINAGFGFFAVLVSGTVIAYFVYKLWIGR
jgi:hypothetical protein